MEKMDVSELEKLIEQLWPEVLASFTPMPRLLGKPRLDSEDSAEVMRSVGREVVLKEDFLRALLAHSDNPESVVRGLLAHQAAHYARFPRDLAAALVLQELASDSFDSVGKQEGIPYLGKQVFQHYVDIVDNLSAYFNSPLQDDIVELYRALGRAVQQETSGHPKPGYKPILLSLALYSAQFGEQLVELPEDMRTFEKEIRKVSFLTDFGWVFRNSGLDAESLRRHELALHQYGNILRKMLKDEESFPPRPRPDSPQVLHGACPDFGSGMGGPGENPSPGELAQALDALRQILPKDAFERVREFAKGQHPESFADAKGIGKGGGLATLRAEESVIEYYLKLSRGLPLFIRKRQLSAPDSEGFPMLHKPYELGDPLSKVDWFRAHGKVLPGLTNVYEDDDDMTYRQKPMVPHCLILMDSSGSMPSPESEKSPHVLCGLAIARNYLANGSLVGALNFSSQSFPVPFGRDLGLIAHALVGYQGGGTEVDLEMLEKLLPERQFLGGRMHRHQADDILQWMRTAGTEMPREAVRKHLDISLDAMPELTLRALDVYIITDGGIYNLDALYENFESLAETARVALLHCPPTFSLESVPEGVEYHRIAKPEDLMGLAARLLERNVGGRHER